MRPAMKPMSYSMSAAKTAPTATLPAKTEPTRQPAATGSTLWQKNRKIATHLTSYGLLENGTFQNGLEGDAVLSAAKQWNSLPEGWPSGQLPTVEFTLYRYPQTNPPADDPEAPEDQKYGDAYATLTINSEDWGDPNSGINRDRRQPVFL